MTQPGIVLVAGALLRKHALEQMRRRVPESGAIKVADLLQGFADRNQAAALRSLHWLIKIGVLRRV